MKQALCLLVLGLVLSQSAAMAQSSADFNLDPRPTDVKYLSQQSTDDWRFSLLVYLWVPGFNGDVTAGDLSTDVDNNPINIWDSLNAAFLGEAELRKGPFTLTVNTIYLGFEADDLGLNNKTTADLDGIIVDVTAGWRVAQWEIGNNSTLSLSPIAGFRYYAIGLGVDVDGVGDADVDEDLWDPVVGARLAAEFGEHWAINFRGDVGGFGVGTQLSWLADLNAAFWFNQHFFITAGYKVMGLDIDENSGPDLLQLQGVLHGPYVGIGFAL